MRTTLHRLLDNLRQFTLRACGRARLSRWQCQTVIWQRIDIVQPETNDKPPLTDEALHFWGSIYVANRLRERNIVFSMFMRAPHEIFSALMHGTPMPLPDGEEFYPLLRPQRLIADAIAAWEERPRTHAIIYPPKEAVS